MRICAFIYPLIPFIFFSSHCYFNSLYYRASKHGLLSQVKKRFCFFWIYYINIQQSLFANQLCHHMVKNYGKVKFFVREFLSSFN